MIGPTIKVACSICGDAYLSIDDIHVYTFELGGEGDYEFKCPICHDVIRRPTNAVMVRMLLNSGVMYTLLPFSIELTEVRGSGDPVGCDEVIDAHLLLENDEAFAGELAYFLEGD